MSSEAHKEFSPSIHEVVHFDEIDCCALKRGFDMNPILTEELKKIVGERSIKYFSGELLDFKDDEDVVVYDEVRTAYSQVAKRELERITAEDEDDLDLSCDYTVKEHQDALREVLKKIGPTIN